MTTHRKASKDGNRRAPHKKVKTGCITCRIRRVKCDEERPYCLRCRTFGIECDGYLVPNKSGQGSAKCLIAPKPWRGFFESEQESRFFNVFYRKTAYHLGWSFNPDLFRISVSQASVREWPIKHALIALGALDVSPKIGATRIRDGMKRENLDPQYLFALQYGRFIRGMKSTSKIPDLRMNLLAALLVICFESYHGNYEAAGLQVHTAFRLIEEWKKKHAHSSAPALTSIHFPSSPALEDVDTELIQVFERLQIQAMSQLDKFSTEEHLRLKDEKIVANMPTEFTSMNEARTFANFYMGRGMHFMGAYEDPTLKGSFPNIWERLSQIGAPTKALVEQQRQHIKDLDRWAAAFESLFKRSLTPAFQHERRFAAILRMHYIGLSVGLKQVFRSDEVFLDSFRSQFAEMIELVEVSLEGHDSEFSLGTQGIIVLDVVAKKCRDSLIRREAIKLLINKPRREAFWDSVLTAKINMWIIDIEEEGMVDGFIPEEARARKTGVKFDMEKRVAHIWTHFPVRKDSLDELRRRETTLRW